MPERRKRPTLYDVAELAGVSHQTVSRLVRGAENIRPDVRDRVEKAITQLSYQPNRAARSLATSRPNRLGALFYESLGDVGPTRILQGASDAAREAGFLLDIVTQDVSDTDVVATALTSIHQTDVAGLIIFARTERIRSQLAQLTFSVPVIIESDDTDPRVNRPENFSDARALELIVEHLVQLGHRRFFEISGPSDWIASQRRTAAVANAVQRSGGTVVGIAEGDWSSETGFAATMAMPLDAGITAVISQNDQMALGALKALEFRGISVPEDVSVTGLDDIPESPYFKPALTTGRIDFYHQGRFAIERLLREIDNNHSVPAQEERPPLLLVRDSTAPAREIAATSAS